MVGGEAEAIAVAEEDGDVERCGQACRAFGHCVEHRLDIRGRT